MGHTQLMSHAMQTFYLPNPLETEPPVPPIILLFALVTAYCIGSQCVVMTAERHVTVFTVVPGKVPNVMQPMRLVTGD